MQANDHFSQSFRPLSKVFLQLRLENGFAPVTVTNLGALAGRPWPHTDSHELGGMLEFLVDITLPSPDANGEINQHVTLKIPAWECRHWPEPGSRGNAIAEFKRTRFGGRAAVLLVALHSAKHVGRAA